MKELGVSANENDVMRLFDSLDSDGGGSLDLAEVKKTFQLLMNTYPPASMN